MVLGVITITRTAITVDAIVVIFAFIVSPFWYKNRLKRGVYYTGLFPQI